MMLNLNDFLPADSGWHLLSATGINNAGQIVGTGEINGQQHAFVMTVVPEPATGAICALGLLWARLRWRV